MTTVNFKMPEEQYVHAQQWAERRKMSFSDFMLYCVEAACRRAELTQETEWMAKLPESVQSLVGVAESSHGHDDALEHGAYIDHLERKYA